MVTAQSTREVYNSLPCFAEVVQICSFLHLCALRGGHRKYVGLSLRLWPCQTLEECDLCVHAYNINLYLKTLIKMTTVAKKLSLSSQASQICIYRVIKYRLRELQLTYDASMRTWQIYKTSRGPLAPEMLKWKQFHV